MKFTLEETTALCPDADRALVEEHLTRLDADYFERFTPEEVANHIKGLTRLSPRNPVELLLTLEHDEKATCTVLAFDYPGVFSLITGVLAGLDFNILSGSVYTYHHKTYAPAQDRRRKPDPRQTALRRRRIIDRFSGKLLHPAQPNLWIRDLRERLYDVFSALEKDEDASRQAARRKVNEMVTRQLIRLKRREAANKVREPDGGKVELDSVLYPVELSFPESTNRGTRLKVVSQDTPAFLYSLSNALSLQGLSIEGVRIQTILGRVENILDVTDHHGNPIEDSELRDHIKLCVLLTKQFTYFLDRAPDPYAALSRYEQIAADMLKTADRDKWVGMLSDPQAMRDLASVLGASDFLWEDFIRLQYEQLVPILQPHLGSHQFSAPLNKLDDRFNRLLEGVSDFDEKRRLFNEFKDRELFLLDLDHILDRQTDLRLLTEKLTGMAEFVVRTATQLVFERLSERYGQPMTIAGIKASFAVFGLGKLGGAALGYASDIELLFVYDDNGQTDGDPAVSNAEFFSTLAQETSHFIETKREGIFRVDLRLRPHGASGPMGVSLESFCKYYGPGGAAHSYERLALVRLRAIGGDLELGAQIERLRDEYIYAAATIQPRELRDLRKKQSREKNKPGLFNAKFSPGALVDLEYSVQLLQVMSGGDKPVLRTPRIHKALLGLTESGILSEDECEQLNNTYTFLRHLINGLRMLRGSAQDLFLPPMDSLEFVHLARRMGYHDRSELEPARQLFVEFETRTAVVRSFVERHLGRESLPGKAIGNVADLILSDEPDQALREKVLTAHGIRVLDRAFANLRALAGTGRRRDLFAKLAVLACDQLKHEPNPDMALNNWERYTRAISHPEAHYKLLFAQPKRFQVLLGIFSRSQFLADTLIQHPEFFDWATSCEVLYESHGREHLRHALGEAACQVNSREEWLPVLRRFRCREILRIGTRDMCLGLPLKVITHDLSVLADAILQTALEVVWRRETSGLTAAERQARADCLCILALGKLGGEELNYSSDIDLIGVYDETRLPVGIRPLEDFSTIIARLRGDLSEHTAEGHVYRVDLRLRPYGKAGNLVYSLKGITRYYEKNAAPWEIQALLKLRPVAGNLELGATLMHRVHALLVGEHKRDTVVETIDRLRRAAQSIQANKPTAGHDIKTGVGGIRDIEFLVQGLQLLHAQRWPDILHGNTMDALNRLSARSLLPVGLAAQLHDDYIFMRRAEHYLQILEDCQIHALPSDPVELTALAKRMLGVDATDHTFIHELTKRQYRVHEAYERFLLNASETPNLPEENIEQI